jgi:flagellar protein FlaG
MEAISNNAVSLGSLLSKVKAPVEETKKTDSNAVSKVAIIPLQNTNLRESSQEMRDAAEVAMKDIQHFISSQARSVRISKDQTSGHMVVQLVDPNSGEVIRTLPSEELLRLARSFEMLGNKMVHQVA